MWRDNRVGNALVNIELPRKAMAERMDNGERLRP
jgi:hypothetical protein